MKDLNDVFKEIQKRYSVTYYNSTRFFPAAIREEVRVLYAFLRYPDEVVDNPEINLSTEQIAAELDAIASKVKQRWFGENKIVNAEEIKVRLNMKKEFSLTLYEDLILFKFVELAKIRDFEYAWVEAFFDSMKMDLSVNRYDNFQQLEKYVYGSAEVVGLMMNRIMRGAEKEHLKDLKLCDTAAAKLGAAMQLTNFLRDIAEDFERGRIYFPAEDFKKFDLTEQEFQDGNHVKFLEFINYQIDRIQQYYKDVFDAPALIPKSSRIPVLTAGFVYYDVLERIAKNPQKLWTFNFKKTLGSFPSAILKARSLSKKA